MADETQLDETLDERDDADRDDLTPERAHELGEFDDLRDRLDSLAEASNKILESLEAVRSSMAAFVEGGATIHEDKEDSPEEEAEDEDAELEIPIEELDFELDD